MNAQDIVRYGHRTVMQTLEDVHEEWWDLGGACGVWSIKNIIAHLASYEHTLVDLLRCFVSGDALAYVSPMSREFNDAEVTRRQHLTPAATLDEYCQACDQSLRLIQQIPPELCRQTGTLPWYGAEYALDDLIVYMFYGHKREHSAQIAAFIDGRGARLD
ncbi:MAG: hypothetical protein HGA45_40550 [Chloroflexales bacterium]|nr:hypothetical protein [Chloroflexales bacterium]